jgi:hypothetical protein
VSRGLVQPFIGAQGEEGLDAAQRREARPGQGRGKGAVSPARGGSAVGN